MQNEIVTESHILTPGVEQTFGELASAHALTEIIINANGAREANRSIWRLYDVSPAGAALIWYGVLTPPFEGPQRLTPPEGIGAGGRIELRAILDASAIDPTSVAVTASLIGYDPECCGESATGTNPDDAPFGCLTVTQAQWYIDAVTGSDTNDGLTPATALQTHAELECRYEGNLALPPEEIFDGPFGPTPIRPVRVTFLTDLPSSDPVGLQTTLGPDVVFLYSAAATITRTSNIAAFSNYSRTAVQKTQTFTDAGFAPGDFLEHVRLRISSGPRAGAVAYLAGDLGAGEVATLNWAIPSSAPFPGVTPIVPQDGDEFVVETLVSFTLKGDWLVGRSANSTAFSLVGICFTDLEFSDATPAAVTLINGRSAGGLTFQTFGCRVRPYFIIAEAYSFHSNSAFLRAVCMHNGFNFLLGGGAFDIGPQPGGDIGRPHCVNVEFGAGVILDLDFMCYGGPAIIVSESYCYVGTAAVFGAKALPFGEGIIPTTGFGITLYTFGTMQCHPFFTGDAKLWGDQNESKGVLVDSTSAFKWDGFNLPSITGLAGVNKDWALDGDTAATTYEESTTTDGDPPAYVTYRPNLWANLALSIGSGGFSSLPDGLPAAGGAQDTVTGSRILVAGIVP
jgi:hypothetical protein